MIKPNEEEGLTGAEMFSLVEHLLPMTEEQAEFEQLVYENTKGDPDLLMRRLSRLRVLGLIDHDEALERLNRTPRPE